MTTILYIGDVPEPKLDIEYPDGGFLYIGDEFPSYPRWKRPRRFTTAHDRFNLLAGIDKKTAQFIAEVAYLIDEGGSSTLTVRDGARELPQALMQATRLDRVDGSDEVKGMINSLLFSDDVRRVLCSDKPNFDFDTRYPTFVRVNRAELGRKNALILIASFIARYQGQIIIPDFGWCAFDPYIDLIYQNRLIARVNYLDELKDAKNLRKAVLLIKDKRPRHSTYPDAVELALQARLRPDPLRADNPYNTFIDEAMA